MSYLKPLYITLLLLICGIESFGQRYNFEQYDIKDGLVQSQVTGITQDKQRKLWIATLGGLSCFNGNQFINLGKTDGLSSNFILSLALDQQINLLIGTERGLSSYKGGSFHNYKGTNDWVDRINTSISGIVYGISGKNIFKLNGQKAERLSITGDTSEIVTTLKTDHKRQIWATVFQHGLYYLEGDKWHQKLRYEELGNLIITDLMVDRRSKDKIWFLTTTGVFVFKNGQVKQAYADIIKKATAINQDERGNIWLGTNRGAWYISEHQTIHFNAKNGFTDNVVNQIFRDAENNIWLGTDGSGIFKFNSKNYVTFDESQGLQNSIVMSIINGPDPDEMWLGTYDGIYAHKNNQIKRINIPSESEDTKRINFLFKDSSRKIWVGTVGGGLWIYSKGTFKRVDEGNRSIASNAILEDRHQNIWISTNLGCFMVSTKAGTIERISRNFETSLLEIGNNLMITGTQNGAYLIRNKKDIKPLNFKPLAGSNILSMLKHGSHVLFGTADNGLIIWNFITGKIKQLSTKDGLFSDHIYSLLLDEKGIIWTGTGRGINKLRAKDFSIMTNTNENVPLVECNQNSIFENKGKIWIGTTKGVVVYDNNAESAQQNKPYVSINSASILAQNKKGNQNNLQVTYKAHELNKRIKLAYNHNHLNINFTGIYLTNPKGIQYKYRLIGLDDKYSHPNSNSSVNYTALPPGEYTFQVKAVTASGISSANTASFHFEITPPYYQTTVFKLLIVAIIILLILLSVYIIINLNERKRKLRLKIKLEEQFKIRKQTAEDFHDDLGNKLTRISVLSEVLSSMTDEKDLEKRSIIQKIKTNVNELYTGTKDILWSLDPKHDTLRELLIHITEFGYEMFNDTPIHFEEETDMNNSDRRLSLELGRNILMIFKEGINNALKYSNADHVNFTAKMNEDILEIVLTDNGTGFNLESPKSGHGINNMQIRANRIKGNLNITSNPNGTTITLSVKF
ncbi:MAG: two-component regulator propeller domain-containing protein [Candidatus Pedobacter colombiensis]|uniref:Two-component regulator propeller domain-containing protein n=1 Tax=Candidatus Pedobacter colombiensis TaxID=3121371 RepID=A0AAJ5WBW4_9SPHI|nr:sensor histidine kinase [Pedobacter sp.]WEK20816.1 MAG: two-component regulator propeller domain-containing protein [Pedobacter sp.]